MAKAASTMASGAWAYCAMRGPTFGVVVDADNDVFTVALHDRQGQPIAGDPILVPKQSRHEWCRIRKPVFPIPAACRHVDDWLVRDFDYGMPDHELDALFGLDRLVDLDAFTAFYESRGFQGGVSLALSEQMQALANEPGVARMLKVGAGLHPLLVLPLDQFLGAAVRPRGCANRHSLAEYPLSEAAEDWAIHHEQARELAGLETAGAECWLDRERERE